MTPNMQGQPCWSGMYTPLTNVSLVLSTALNEADNSLDFPGVPTTLRFWWTSGCSWCCRQSLH